MLIDPQSAIANQDVDKINAAVAAAILNLPPGTFRDLRFRLELEVDRTHGGKLRKPRYPNDPTERREWLSDALLVALELGGVKMPGQHWVFSRAQCELYARDPLAAAMTAAYLGKWGKP